MVAVAAVAYPTVCRFVLWEAPTFHIPEARADSAVSVSVVKWGGVDWSESRVDSTTGGIVFSSVSAW